MSSNGWLLKKFHFCARNLIDILLNSVESFFFQLCTHSTQPLKFRKWCKIILKGKTISDTQVRDVTHPRASRIFIFIVSSTNRKSRARTKESLDEDFSKEIHNYIYFWKINSVFSQWFPCTFVVDGITYNSAIQYMMHQKAGKSHLNIAHIFRPDHIIKKMLLMGTDVLIILKSCNFLIRFSYRSCSLLFMSIWLVTKRLLVQIPLYALKMYGNIILDKKI